MERLSKSALYTSYQLLKMGPVFNPPVYYSNEDDLVQSSPVYYTNVLLQSNSSFQQKFTLFSVRRLFTGYNC